MKIDLFETNAENLHRNMTFRVILPDDYENIENSNKKYPVLYMQDGQNILKDEDAVDGISYQYDNYYKKYKRFLPEIIIVAIDCPLSNPERTRLYTPYHGKFNVKNRNFESDIEGEGKEYLHWLVYELKPWIDQEYRTYKEKEFTGIGGYSTGGIISMYALMAYPDTFTRVLTLSAAFYIWFNFLNQTIEESSFKNLKYVYLDVGGNDEGRMTQKEQFIKGNKMMYQKFIDLGFDERQIEFKIFDLDNHNCRSFGRRFPDAIRWIYQDIF